jgi:hypothetical protein
MLGNAIVRKELIQAARRRRTYIIRAGLPALAALLLLPQVLVGLGRYGQDWRAIASLSRPLFMTSAWLQLVVFPLLAFSLTAEALAREWRERTIEVLRVTALSSAGIVYGKLVGALSQVLMAALALLPFTAVLYFLSRLPREAALGSFAIIVGSVLVCGSLGALQGATMRPRERIPAGALTLFFVLLGGLALLDGYVWVGHPLLEAAIPPRALSLVLQAGAPAGWGVGQFALLSLGVLVGASAFLLALAPALYDRTFARLIGTPERKTLGERLRRRLGARRPAMKPEENPFFWQERGPATRVLSWSVLVVFGVLVVFYGLLAVFVATVRRDLTLGGLRELCLPALNLGLLVVLFGSVFYGARVFSREKSQHTATALVLTGRSPREFFWAKIRALYWAHRYSFVILVLVLLAWGCALLRASNGLRNGHVAFAAAVSVLLFGPGVSALVGMVFGVVSNSPQQATRWLFLSLVLLQVLSPVVFLALEIGSNVPLGFALIVAVIVGVLAAFLKLTRRWTPWRMSLMLASWFAVSYAEIALITFLLHGKGAGGAVLVVLSAFLLVAGFTYFWWRLGMHVFEEGMSRESASSSRALRA